MHMIKLHTCGKKRIFRLYTHYVIKTSILTSSTICCNTVICAWFSLLIELTFYWWRCVLDFRCSLSWHLLMIVCAWFSLLVELALMCADLDVCLFFSAGVGRTGVFITLSIVLERMRYEGVVDMFQTVKMLRTQRPAMVQTEVRNTANCYHDLA